VAVWQFDINCLTSAVVEEALGAIPLRFTDRSWENEPWFVPPKDLDVSLARLLPPAPSWHAQLLVWGEEAGNRIDRSLSDEEYGEGLQLRFDVRSPSMDLLTQFCTLGLRHGWIFVTEGGRVSAPTVRSMAKAISESTASKFVRDPHGTLAEIAASPHDE